jgi:hypothetical protein
LREMREAAQERVETERAWNESLDRLAASIRRAQEAGGNRDGHSAGAGRQEKNVDEPAPRALRDPRTRRGPSRAARLGLATGDLDWDPSRPPQLPVRERVRLSAGFGAAERLGVEPLGRPAERGHVHTVGYRSVRSPVRTSSEKSSGCSQAAKCPPLSSWL